MRTSENIYVVILTFVGLGIVVISDKIGTPQKWHAAIVGTMVTFGGVAWVFRGKWRRWQFWASLGVLFTIHILAMWLVFTQILASVKTLGILIWAPVAFVEGILLLGLVPLLERRLFHL